MRRALPWAAAFSFLGAVVAQAQSLPSPQAEACLSCHGSSGHPGSFPDIAHLDAPLMSEAMAQFRTGARTGTIMNRIAKGYSDEESRAITNELVKALAEAKP